ncbi:F-type H+-transporting ATPase subunit gamma [Salinibacter ruber]|uniref:ATP synthase gamma chain n=1 Tax=Salinibacter ruber TaxID=146919 RepID=A0AAW5P3D8_9BACT|nr:ATP synthase F1 subunit gamma [Salinibacter ruber]MCS3662878.1 F-type H+-transporting ATPase subunit gamma [Salinibacter ruber]MCS4156209.1 F-type H+-transporting ATPase subunit gamma [Salinibacter ruber]MCS4222341.1 F-type H+-transporting ATPase subunit gamma [Salinibacter ruber]
MANLRDIRNRIDSIENTKQVTRAMKMVAAAKLRRAQEKIFRARPYAYKIGELTNHLKQELDPTAHPFFQAPEEASGALVIVITADRGLCGSFNSDAINTAEHLIETTYAETQSADDLFMLCVGKKGHKHFQKRDYRLVGDYKGVFDGLNFDVAQRVVEDAVEGFERGIWGEVKLVYNEFKNTIVQNQIVEPLLPIPEERFETPVMEEEADGFDLPENGRAIDYIFEPGAPALLDELVPRYLYYQVWRALLESNAAEQGARMVAMDNATSNAEELIEDLTLEYNRARQSAITRELLDITSGAEALEESG